MKSITGSFTVTDMNTVRNHLDIDTIKYSGTLSDVIDYGTPALVPNQGSTVELYRNKTLVEKLFAGEHGIYIYRD
jgi:hypothetical protein